MENPFKNFTPFPEQRENIIKLMGRSRALLSSKVGSGKTMTVIGAFGALVFQGKARWLFVFMPLNAYEKGVWQKDIERFTTFRVGILDEIDDIKKLDDYDIILCKHTHVKGDKVELIRFMSRCPEVYVCIDESHAFKNPKANITVCMAEMLENAVNRWFITGTTLSKSVEDTYYLLNLLSPGCLGNFFQFRATYCSTKEVVIGKYPNGKLKKAINITGLKDQDAFHRAVEPYMITGDSFVYPEFHYIDYELSDDESALYSTIANGIDLNPDLSIEDWLEQALENKTFPDNAIKSVERFSSRFIYLQSCADGTLTKEGLIANDDSTKIGLFIAEAGKIIAKGQSCIVYFDYLETLNIVKDVLARVYGDRVRVLESSGKHRLDPTLVTEESVRGCPTFILGTRASSESVSYYFINNVIFFHCPTVPHTAIQLVGRITRKNTLYPGDLHVTFFRSYNIDLYKLMLVSYKTGQLEAVQGRECNIPDDYKDTTFDTVGVMRKCLLWRK